MSRIEIAFSKGKAFIAFLTAGDPDGQSTVKYTLAMAGAGADIIELGIPFSDPTGEGEVIQRANARALEKGMTVDGVFGIVRAVRKKSEVPLVLLTYINPVYVYGCERFFSVCEEAGVDGIIVPDLPFEERDEIAPYAEKHGIDLIPLIAPTSEDRTGRIAASAQGFAYIVSSLGVTGVRGDISADVGSIAAAVRRYAKVPAAVGFGISTTEQAREMAALSDGAIVGSAIVKIIERLGDNAEEELVRYVRAMKAAVLGAQRR